jgi:hypothetical protein
LHKTFAVNFVKIRVTGLIWDFALMKNYRHLILSLSCAVCIAFAVPAAFADPSTVPGCDSAVTKAQQARAQAKVCADIAITNQLTHQPDSVLNLTCFNKSAAISAKEGGKIFSNPDGNDGFKDDLATIIEPALKSSNDNFDNATGKDFDKDSNNTNKIYDNTDTLGNGSDGSCTAMDDLWKYDEGAGINRQVPTAITDDDLTKDAPPLCDDGNGGTVACGQDFQDAWTACAKNKVFSDYATAVAAVPKPAVPEFDDTDDTSCKVMLKAGVVTTCP